MNELILRKNGGFYSVYGDDYILIHYDKNYLKKCLLDISEKLEKENKL